MKALLYREGTTYKNQHFKILEMDIFENKKA